jgi:hypothetical protein
VTEFDLDLIVVGGGVQGLLVLREAINAGRSAVLFEGRSLGAGQSLHSQAYLIHGLLYARSARKREKRPSGADTAVFGSGKKPAAANSPFRRGGSEWEAILRPFKIKPTKGAAFHLIGPEVDKADKATLIWDQAKLWHKDVKKGWPKDLARREKETLFLSQEAFFPDAASAVRALSARLAPHLFAGEVVHVDPATGEITWKPLEEGSEPRKLRARRVVLASGLAVPAGVSTALLPVLHGNKMVGLFATGPRVPEFALVFDAMLGGLTAKVMGVPRGPIAGKRPDRAWLCSSLLGQKIRDWRRPLAERVLELFPLLDRKTTRFGCYEQKEWPAFEAEHVFQIREDPKGGHVVAVYPTRLTLAPLAAKEVWKRIAKDLGTPCTTPVLDGTLVVTQARVRGRSISAKPTAPTGAAAAEP